MSSAEKVKIPTTSPINCSFRPFFPHREEWWGWSFENRENKKIGYKDEQKVSCPNFFRFISMLRSALFVQFRSVSLRTVDSCQSLSLKYCLILSLLTRYYIRPGNKPTFSLLHFIGIMAEKIFLESVLSTPKTQMFIRSRKIVLILFPFRVIIRTKFYREKDSIM